MGSLFGNLTGSYNVAVGPFAGYTNSTGNSNVYLGPYAGYNETGSNKLYIDNSNTVTPLIYGDFSTDIVKTNATYIQAWDTTSSDIVDMAGINVMYFDMAAADTVASISNEQIGAEYTFMGLDAVNTITFEHSAVFIMAGGVNFIMGLYDVIKFRCVAMDVFIEISRSDN